MITMKNILSIQKTYQTLQKFVAKIFSVENWNNNIEEANLDYKSSGQLIYNFHLYVLLLRVKIRLYTGAGFPILSYTLFIFVIYTFLCINISCYSHIQKHTHIVFHKIDLMIVLFNRLKLQILKQNYFYHTSINKTYNPLIEFIIKLKVIKKNTLIYQKKT